MVNKKEFEERLEKELHPEEQTAQVDMEFSYEYQTFKKEQLNKKYTLYEKLCNAAGRVESCGGSEYCCPEAGGAWTTDMTACTVDPSPSPSPTPEVSPSPSPSPSVSPTPEVSPSPEASPSPDASPTATPTTEPTVTYSCNSSCSSNSQCQSANSSYICYLSKCRLDSNPTSDQCAQSSSTTTQPELPAELPESGSEDILNWFKAGLGALGIGTVLLLLL